MDLPLLIFAALLGATGLMRLGEVWVSWRRLRDHPEQLVAEPRLFPAMVLLHVGFVFGPLLEVGLLHRPFVPVLAAVAGGVLVAATALRVWTLRTLGGAWNVRVVVPNAVVTTGPYGWIRHPNYLVVALEIAALPLVHNAWLSAVLLSGLNAAVLYQRIRTEEAALSKIPAWRDAMRDRKRLIPGVF